MNLKLQSALYSMRYLQKITTMQEQIEFFSNTIYSEINKKKIVNAKHQ